MSAKIALLVLAAFVFFVLPAFQHFYYEFYGKPREARAMAEETLPEDASEKEIKAYKQTVQRWMK